MTQTSTQNKDGFIEVHGSNERVLLDYKNILTRAAAAESLIGKLLTDITSVDAETRSIVVKDSESGAVKDFIRSVVLVFPHQEILRQDIRNLTAAASAVQIPVVNQSQADLAEIKRVH